MGLGVVASTEFLLAEIIALFINKTKSFYADKGDGV